MQYWRLRGHNTSVGDCMPFFHEGRYHLVYLFDRRHHMSKWGLGAHQWAHASTADLIHWEHHPLAIEITEQWEGSICTGSVFCHDGMFRAFYATRKPDGSQHLGLAVSRDGIHFSKTQPNPFASPEKGYHRDHYRDPTVFQDPATGRFHLLVTALLNDGNRGCLAQLVSNDLKSWTLTNPFITPRMFRSARTTSRGTVVLLDFHGLLDVARPARAVDPTEGQSPGRDAVPKTAEFTGNRRIAAFWLADGGWAGTSYFANCFSTPTERWERDSHPR